MEEADNMEPFVDDDGVVEAATAGSVESQVKGVDAPGVPVTNTGVATIGSTLVIEREEEIRQSTDELNSWGKEGRLKKE